MTELQPIAWLLLDQGCRAPDDCEDFERVVMNHELPTEELKRFIDAGRAHALMFDPFHPTNYRLKG